MTDLTDRMRTCAARILYCSEAKGITDEWKHVCADAADLLIEASNALEACEATGEACVPLGDPIEIIPPPPDALSDELKRKIDTVVAETEEKLVGTWIAPGGPLPAAPRLRSPRACPRCDSRANKTVYRQGNLMMLRCPVCAERWEFKP